MSELLPRITGTEMEWSLRVQSNPDEPFRRAEDTLALNLINRFHDERIFRVQSWLSNGARFYKDVGDHLEYSTPEDTSFWGTVTNEIAGERLLYEALHRERERFLAWGNDSNFRGGSPGVYDFKLNKRVVDDELHTWGYHTSFCSPAGQMQINEMKLGLVGLHLATQNLYAGAGAVCRLPGQDWSFCLAQKVLNLNKDYALSTCNQDQPLLSTRDEPLTGDISNWKRVHLTSMDANMSPWATWMRLGTTSLVLRLVEHNEYGNGMMPHNSVPLHKLAQLVASDMAMTKTVELQDGMKVYPINIQEELVARVEKLSTRVALPAEELEVIQEWKKACDDLRTDYRLLVDRSDWVAKWLTLQRYMQKHDLPLGSDEVRSKDRQWDNIGPHGIGQALRQSIWKKWMPDEQAIETAQAQPPATTRATLRGQTIKEICEMHYPGASVGWPQATWTGLPKPRKFHDPYQTSW